MYVHAILGIGRTGLKKGALCCFASVVFGGIYYDSVNLMNMN